MATVSSINYNPQIMHKATSFGKNAEASGTKKSETENEPKIIYIEKPRVKSSKKWGVGIASYLLPGLGQLINGEGTSKVLGFFGSSMALGLLAYAGSFQKNKTLLVGSALGGIGVGIWSVIDAVKHVRLDYVAPNKHNQKGIETEA